MATTAKTYGLANAVYGVSQLTGFVVQTYNLGIKPGVNAQIHDETGVRVHSRYDDNQNEMALDMVVNGGTIPVPGDTLTYDSVTYEIQDVQVKGANKDFKKVSVKLLTSAGITYPVVP